MNEGSGTTDQGSGSHQKPGSTAPLRKSIARSRRPPDWRPLAGPALILLSAAFATAPQFVRGPSCGHDFDFHLVSWLDALSSWHHGLFYPHWTPSPNYGAGEPRFMFYPPLTWMLGALLGAVLPWRVVPMALVFLLLAATGLATRALARQALSDGPATLAGCAAIFCGYTLFTAYERSAFGEMTGGFWTPALLMLILRDRKRTAPGPPDSRPSHIHSAFDGSALLLSLVVAGAWLSNAPLGVMLSYLLAAVAITVAILKRSWAPLLRAGAATLVGLALSAFFLVPAAWEQRWVAIRQAVDDPGLLIENSWLFARHADPRLELHDVELIRVSFIGVTMVAVALLGLLVSLWRKTLSVEQSWWVPLGLIPVVVLLLQFPVSEPLWTLLPKLRFLQFPWRWLVVLEAPMAIFFAAALWVSGRVWRIIAVLVSTAVFTAATAIASISMFQACDQEDDVNGMVADYRAGNGFEGTDEYAPLGADNSLVATNLSFSCLVLDPETTLGKGDPDTAPEWSADQGTCDATFPEAHGSEGAPAEHVRLVASTPHSGYLVLRLRSYPAWRISLNGATVGPLPTRDDGLMAVPVPQGRVELSADWTTTRDVVTGRLISLVGLLLVTGLWLLEYRSSRARL